MKKLDAMIESLELLRAEIEANRLIREGKMISITLNREPRSPAEVFRDPPKFSIESTIDLEKELEKLAQEAKDWDTGIKKPTDPEWFDVDPATGEPIKKESP
jgi:hypothetical protein